MNTRWNTSYFLFLGILSAVFAFYYVICGDKRKSFYPLILSAVLSIGALGVIIVGLNQPSKIITILSTPKKGFSMAVIMQCILCATSLVGLLKYKSRTTGLSALLFAVGIVSLYALSKVYMISTRPALNSICLSAVFIFMAVWLAALLAGEYIPAKYTLCACGLYILAILVFILRLNFMPVVDRVLTFSNVVAGSYAVLFWGMILLTVFVPLIYLRKASKRSILSIFVNFCAVGGIMLMSILVNQAQIVEKGINSRIYF